MNYSQVLTYLYEKLPMFQRIGAAALKKDLDNTLLLCEALDNPQNKFKSVHIAGTNGKGSSSHMIAAVLQSAGYKTGLYTSPHLKNFTERIKINGQEIPQQNVVDFVLKHKGLIEEVMPSFFEMTVAMAYDYFVSEKVDIAVIEVGLGGRLDSTNVITPIASLITNISYDHQYILGNTLPEIAFEKAGIIKSNIPVVISQTQNAVKQVFELTALEKNAPLYFADNIYKSVKKSLSSDKLIIDVYKDDAIIFPGLEMGLTADYQLKNISGVLKIVDVLNTSGFKIDEEALRNGIGEAPTLTGLKGRWQILERKPLLICDTGHNEDGIKLVVDQIQATPHESLFIVFGTVKDKDPGSILRLLPKEAHYYFCEAHIPRALPAEDLCGLAKAQELNGTVIKNVNDAILEAKKHAKENDLIFVGGSNFVVAEIDNL